MHEVFEKIIDKLEEYKKITGINTIGSYCQSTLSKAIEIVKQADAEYNNGWIPCSERLPEYKGKYLVCDDKGNVYVSTYYGYSWLVISATDEVIAWQPLTEQYHPKGE